jgi:SOS-response transcriptional repressor LexA
MKPLTHRQAEIVAFMRAFYAENDQLPPLHAIKTHFGWSSDNGAHQHLEALARKGCIERNAVGKYRFTRANTTIAA